MAFDGRIKDAITAAKGRNAKAIAALLDVDALRASKNQEADIRAALEALKKDNGYLFESETPPPLFQRDRHEWRGHIFRFFRKKRKNLLQSSCSGVVYSRDVGIRPTI